jgi:hypothetical protein
VFLDRLRRLDVRDDVSANGTSPGTWLGAGTRIGTTGTIVNGDAPLVRLLQPIFLQHKSAKGKGQTAKRSFALFPSAHLSSKSHTVRLCTRAQTVTVALCQDRYTEREHLI